MAIKRPSVRAISLMVAVLVLGGIVGVLGTLFVGRMRRPPRRQPFIDRISQQLQLSAKQKTDIQAIMDDGHDRFNNVFQQSQDQAQAQYDAIRQDVNKRIRAVLTPTQQTKYDDFLKRLNAEHNVRPSARRSGRRGRGPGPPSPGSQPPASPAGQAPATPSGQTPATPGSQAPTNP